MKMMEKGSIFMGFIVSINGSDGSGKTTQIDLLKKNSIRSVFFPPDIAKYGVFPKLPPKESFEWWFYKSTLEEFCGAIYRGIKYRNEEIKYQNKPITVIDKGIDTFESRILANYLCRGMEKEVIIQKMQEIRKQVGVQDNEDLKLFLLIDSDIDQRLKISKSRKGTSFGQPHYDRYQRKLNEIMEMQIKEGIYKIIDAKGDINQVNNVIVNTIKDQLLNREKEGVNDESERS